MQRKIVLTEDGSPTLFVPELNEHYHSIHGAVQESQHVFIQHGLRKVNSSKSSLNLLEIGFGTGLNAFLTLIESASINIQYTAVEAYPLSLDEAKGLNYAELMGKDDMQASFLQLHQCDWESPQNTTPKFSLFKTRQKIESLTLDGTYDLIYFDAFAPEVQPELWTQAIFEQMFQLLNTGGCLLTYCAKGSVKRNMKTAGFSVEGLPGPPGKREITRATK